MGTEAVWIPAAIAALGAGVGAYTTHKAASEQDDLAAQGIRDQSRSQRQANESINSELGSLEASNPDAERQKALDEYLSTLRANRAQAGGGTPLSGASDEYRTDASTTSAGIQNYGEKYADILSRIFAPQRQREQEGYSVARTGSDVTGIARDASGNDFVNRLRISAAQPNPWILAGGELAQGVGSSMAMNAGAAQDAMIDNMKRTGYDPVTRTPVARAPVPRKGPFA